MLYQTNNKKKKWLLHDWSVLIILPWGYDQYCQSHDQSVFMILPCGATNITCDMTSQ